jgi:adenosylcobinamide-phosphate synthase
MRDRHRHTSPNAGQSEAAMAGALSIRLGGSNTYNGVPSPKPLLNAAGRHALQTNDGWRAMRLAAAASVTAFSILFLRALRRADT